MVSKPSYYDPRVWNVLRDSPVGRELERWMRPDIPDGIRANGEPYYVKERLLTEREYRIVVCCLFEELWPEIMTLWREQRYTTMKLFRQDITNRHLINGVLHKPSYRELARMVGMDSSLLIRGLESALRKLELIPKRSEMDRKMDSAEYYFILSRKFDTALNHQILRWGHMEEINRGELR
jgi:hypothetical protein